MMEKLKCFEDVMRAGIHCVKWLPGEDMELLFYKDYWGIGIQN